MLFIFLHRDFKININGIIEEASIKKYLITFIAKINI